MIDDLTAGCNAPGVPHLLTETGHYKGYVFPKGSLFVANAWYASTFIILYSVSLHVLSGQCYGTQEFTLTRINSTQTVSWQLTAMSRRWIPARSVYLDLGGGASTFKLERE